MVYGPKRICIPIWRVRPGPKCVPLKGAEVYRIAHLPIRIRRDSDLLLSGGPPNALSRAKTSRFTLPRRKSTTRFPSLHKSSRCLVDFQRRSALVPAVNDPYPLL